MYRKKAKSLSRVRLLATPCTVAYQAPPSMAFSRQNTGLGCHFLLQGIFPTQGLNLGLPHCRQTLHTLSLQGSPYTCIYADKSKKMEKHLKSAFDTLTKWPSTTNECLLTPEPSGWLSRPEFTPQDPRTCRPWARQESGMNGGQVPSQAPLHVTCRGHLVCALHPCCFNILWMTPSKMGWPRLGHLPRWHPDVLRGRGRACWEGADGTGWPPSAPAPCQARELQVLDLMEGGWSRPFSHPVEYLPGFPLGCLHLWLTEH